MSLRLAAMAALGAALLSGIVVHRYDVAIHGRAVADLRADAATTLADQTEIVLRLMQEQIDKNAKLEDDYAHLAQDTARAKADGVRLSADLDAARRGLLALAGADRRGGGGALGQADAGADGCTELRAALGRADAALELLERGGDEATAIGQLAVDVATIAAQAARATIAAQDAAHAPEIAP